MNEKIIELEKTLSGYKKLKEEHHKTVTTLRGTINKVIEQRDDAKKQLEILQLSPNTPKGTKLFKQEELIKKNKELSDLADALASNLERKEKSLEEALLAINTLQGTKNDVMGKIAKGKKLEKRRSITNSISNTFNKIKNNNSNNKNKNNQNNNNTQNDELSMSTTMSFTGLDSIADDYEHEPIKNNNSNNRKLHRKTSSISIKGGALDLQTELSVNDFENDSKDEKESSILSPSSIRSFADKITTTVRNSLSSRNIGIGTKRENSPSLPKKGK